MNFLAEWAKNGQEALSKIASYNYDAIVLDVNMPIMGGKELLMKLRKRWKNTPIIALTSNSMLTDKLEMFDLWVDDYMTKPFEIQELVVRIKAVGKRSDVIVDTTQTIGSVEINFSTHKIFVSGEEIYFPHKQYLIVEYLSKNLWYPKNKLQIMEYVWGEQEENLELKSTTLESHIYSIRAKLGKQFIKTRKGVGYIIE